MSLPSHLFRSVTRRSVLTARPRTFSYSPSLLVRPQNPTPKAPPAQAAPAASPSTPQDPPSASPLDPSTSATPPPLEPFVDPGKATPPPTSTFSDSTTPPTADPKAATPPVVEEEVFPDRPDLTMLPSLDVDPSALPEPGTDEAGKPTGAKSSKQQTGFNTFDKLFLGSLGLGLIGGGWYLGRPLTDEEREKLKLKVRFVHRPPGLAFSRTD